MEEKELVGMELTAEDLEQVAGGIGTDGDPAWILELITRAVLKAVRQLMGSLIIDDYETFSDWYEQNEKIIDVLVQPWLASDYYAIYMAMRKGPRAAIREDVFMRIINGD